jgi:hypothetical protein
MIATLYQGAIFYQNDIKYVKLDAKSADICFRMKKQDESEKNE